MLLLLWYLISTKMMVVRATGAGLGPGVIDAVTPAVRIRIGHVLKARNRVSYIKEREGS